MDSAIQCLNNQDLHDVFQHKRTLQNLFKLTSKSSKTYVLTCICTVGFVVVSVGFIKPVLMYCVNLSQTQCKFLVEYASLYVY